jgi:hypothetical protein
MFQEAERVNDIDWFGSAKLTYEPNLEIWDHLVGQ